MSIGNIDYRRWKNETGVTLKIRSSQLRELDKAIERYCNPGGGTATNLETVKKKFRAWKGSAVGRNTSSRNASGIVEELEGYLNGTTPMKNAYLDSQVDGRLGLLYVYGGLDVDTKLFNLVLESAFELGAMGFSGATDDLKAAMPGSMDKETKANLASLGSDVLGNDIVKAGRDKLIGRAGDAFANRGQKKQAIPTPPPRPAPRALAVGAPLPKVNPVVGGALRMGKGVNSIQALEQPASEPPNAALQFGQKVINMIREKLKEFAAFVWAKLKKQFDKFQEAPFDYIKDWGARVATLVNFIVCKILGEAGRAVAPVVGGAIAIGKGIADTISACKDKYDTWIVTKEVNFSPGHPEAVVDSIKLTQTAGIGQGIYGTLKGATQLGLDVGAAASGTIFGLVVTGCEILAKFIHRLWDSSRLKSFAIKCQAMYTRNKALIESGKEASELRAGEFGKMMRSYMLSCPTIASVGLTSNFAGDAMQWLDMNSTFNKGADVSKDDWKAGNKQFDDAAASFAKGTEALSHLKKLAREFLLDSGFVFKHRDPTVGYFLTASNMKKPGVGSFDA